MTETLVIVLCSNLVLICGAYWVLKYKPNLLTVRQPMPVDDEPVMISMNGAGPERPMKICIFCDEPISRAARRCRYCTSNLPASGG